MVRSLRSRLGSPRITGPVRGVVPAAIALPLILRVWCPGWFVAAWAVLYVVMSAVFIGLIAAGRSLKVEHAWSIVAAIVLSGVPISAVVWSDRPGDFWAAAMVTMTFMAFEMADTAFLRIGEWRIGIWILAAVTSICGLAVVNPAVALLIGVAVLVVTQAIDRVRDLKFELEDHLVEAQRVTRSDALTGLLNRRGLASRIDELGTQPLTVALVDVDRFKFINDSHGHQVGDEALVAIANELRLRFDDAFAIARLGGDEFVAVAAGRHALDETIAAPVQVMTKLHRQAVMIECGLSIGVSYGENPDVGQRLLSEAGFAMREAKRTGGSLARFGQDLSERLDRTLQVAAISSGATDNGTFVPVGQAILDADKIVGCELLIRWMRPDGSIVTPAHFLPMAVEAGLMSLINDLMLEHAITFAARFNNRPSAPFVSVNLSAPHLAEGGFSDRVESLLAEHRVPAERLMIEITENEEFGRYDQWEHAAAELRSLGVKLAIDDFGTGYSSIERLQDLPITHLKFDRSLVQSVSGPVGEIVGGLTSFAKAVNIGVIAEGVETLDEHESVRAFGISTVQGFLFHKPEALDGLETLIIEDYLRWSNVGEVSEPPTGIA